MQRGSDHSSTLFLPTGQQCLPPDILPWPSGATVHHPPITLWTGSAHTFSGPLSSSLYPPLQRVGGLLGKGRTFWLGSLPGQALAPA